MYYTQHILSHNRWIGDGECDDFCRTAECLYDGGDCELGMNIFYILINGHEWSWP